MPGGDRTGPLGLGPGTGWGRGFCHGYPVPGYVNSAGGRWFGSGRGFGRGLGWGRGRFGIGKDFWGASPYPYASNITPRQEADMLKEEAKAMQDEIRSINKRIAELESEDKSK